MASATMAPTIAKDCLLYHQLDTPIGNLTVAVTSAGLSAISFPDDASGAPTPAASSLGRLPRRLGRFTAIEDDTATAPAIEWLNAYFAGENPAIDSVGMPLDFTGSEFQQAVWQELARIPYGETRSYGELAASIGNAGAARAVGLANGQNPLSVLIPCHRVIGASGKLTGFGGGLWRKEWLLGHERGDTLPL